MRAWRGRAKALKAQALAVWYAARDPAMPWWLRALALAIAAYAFSPIDLVPDFIPVLGLLDDLVLLPLGVALLVRLTPPSVMARAQARAAIASERPTGRVAATVVIAVWVLVLGSAAWWWSRRQAGGA
jgi:uncharacterized membrane protein YkvA (DUF1232 family)